MSGGATAGIDYRTICGLAAATGRSRESLIALTRNNDPFYITEGRERDAEWFADLYRRFAFGAGVHLRRIHYIVVSQREPVRLPDGERYVNTNGCWKKLFVASKDARYAGLVDVDEFVDRRNPEVDVYLPTPVDRPGIIALSADSGFEVTLPYLYDAMLPGIISATLPKGITTPSLWISGECPTPYHVELWAEKSTVNDVLRPLAVRYGLNFQPSVGEVSVTLCRDLAARVRANGNRPARIIYVSDFDVAGQSIPIAAARKLEWFIRESGEGLDVQLQPVVLTFEQCNQYRLPRTPYSETDRRAARFEDRYGEGRTELDALEALHPGELRRILVREIERFHDPNSRLAWRQMTGNAQCELDELRERIVAAYHVRHPGDDPAARLQSLREQIEEIQADAQEQLDRRLAEVRRQIEEIQAGARAQLDTRLEGLREQVEQLQADVIARNVDIEQELEAAAPDIEDMGLELRQADEWPDPLFDSKRDYVEQIYWYKRHQGKTPVRQVEAEATPDEGAADD